MARDGGPPCRLRLNRHAPCKKMLCCSMPQVLASAPRHKRHRGNKNKHPNCSRKRLTGSSGVRLSQNKEIREDAGTDLLSLFDKQSRGSTPQFLARVSRQTEHGRDTCE